MFVAVVRLAGPSSKFLGEASSVCFSERVQRGFRLARRWFHRVLSYNFSSQNVMMLFALFLLALSFSHAGNHEHSCQLKFGHASCLLPTAFCFLTSTSPTFPHACQEFNCQKWSDLPVFA
jgi:hypothetical protein